MRASTVSLTLIIAATLATCVQPPASAVDDKLDPDLREALERVDRGEDAASTRFAVLVRSREEPERERLDETGLAVETVAGRLVTAVGTAIAIRRAAAVESVESISLSHTVDYPLPDDV